MLQEFDAELARRSLLHVAVVVIVLVKLVLGFVLTVGLQENRGALQAGVRSPVCSDTAFMTFIQNSER